MAVVLAALAFAAPAARACDGSPNNHPVDMGECFHVLCGECAGARGGGGGGCTRGGCVPVKVVGPLGETIHFSHTHTLPPPHPTPPRHPHTRSATFAGPPTFVASTTNGIKFTIGQMSPPLTVGGA